MQEDDFFDLKDDKKDQYNQEFEEQDTIKEL